jgi:prolyl-tRNA synthetase
MVIRMMEKHATPGKTKCADVAEFLGVPITQMVKAIAVMVAPPQETGQKEAGQFVLLLLRGDHDLNEIKAQKCIGEFRFARDEEIVERWAARPATSGRWASPAVSWLTAASPS